MRSLLSAAALTALFASAASAETVYLTAARMIDVQKGVSVSDPAIVIADGKIAAVGTRATLAAPAGAKTVDLGARTILPGLIDLHVHLSMDGRNHGFGRMAKSEMERGYVAVQQAERTLKAGFTTVRDVGDSNYQAVDLAKSIDAGMLTGPSIIAAGTPIGATGGHMDENLLPRDYNDVGKGIADGPWAIRAMVRKHHKYGAKVIKFAASGGVMSQGDDVAAEQYSYDEITALVDEAHMLGLKVASHAHGAKAIANAIRAGVDTIEHASLIDDAGIKLAKEKGTYLDFTPMAGEAVLAAGTKVGILEESLGKARKITKEAEDSFTRALKAGATITFGTDAGVFPNGENATQFALMVKLGMTPMQAIQAATATNAAALGKSDEIGAIAPGLAADIIATSGDPLEDVTRLEHVDFVMKAGEVVKGVK